MLRIHTSKVEPGSLIPLFSRVNDLLSLNVEVRRAMKSTRGKGEGNTSAGDFLVEEGSVPGASNLTKRFADEVGVKVTRMASHDPNTAPRLRTPVVGLYSGYGTSPRSLIELHDILEETGFNLISFMDSQDLEEALSRVDVLIMPGGDSTEIALSLGPDNARSIRKFVEAGGTYLGICAGSFLAVSFAQGSFGPNHQSFSAVQQVLGNVNARLLNDVAESPGTPMWSYKNFGNVLRVYPYEGDVEFRAKKRSDPIALGLPSKFILRMAGPVFKVKDSADVVAVSVGPVPTTTYGVKPKDAHPLFMQFDAIVRKKVGSGFYVLSSPHIESRDHPEGPVLLANSLLSAVSGTVSLSVSTGSQALDAKQTSLLMASMVDQSDELSRSLLRLSAYLAVLVPLVHGAGQVRHWSKIAELDHSMSYLSEKSQDVTRMTVELILEQEYLDKLLASVSKVIAGTKVVNMEAQHLIPLLSRVDQERNSMIATAGRALPALAMVSLKLEKEAAELISKLTKGDDLDVLKETAMLVQKIAGDRAHYVPWYDGREGLASDEPPTHGILSPLMGVHAKMKRVRSISRAVRLLSTS